MNVLVVEDDERTRDFFVQTIQLKGHHVREAANGAQAVAMASQGRFDLVMMDVRMPKLDGVTACQQIRTTSPSTHVVLLTGYRLTDELTQLMEAGSLFACLQKPVLRKDLEALLERAARSTQATNEPSPPASPPTL